MLSQSFGAETSENEADILTAVEFDDSGDYMATGDKGGRIVLFSRFHPSSSSKSTRKEKSTPDGDAKTSSPTKKRSSVMQSWRPYFQFQSHEPGFDYLKSVQIEEKINQIKFCRSIRGSVVLLTTNDKTVKLWKVNHRAQYSPCALRSLEMESTKSSSKTVSSEHLKLPLPSKSAVLPTANAKQVYDHAHLYHINSLSTNSDGRTFISGDDLRINWWDLEVGDKCFNVIDLKPDNIKDLSEVITVAKFHPIECNTLIFATSKGLMRVADTRIAALCDNNSKIMPSFQESANVSSRTSYFSEVLSAVSDFTVTPDGRCVVARDYLSMKVWDLRMNNQPLRKIPVNNYLYPALEHMYENQCMFDKFRVVSSFDSSKFVTGGYSNRFTVYHSNGLKYKDFSLPGATPFYKEKAKTVTSVLKKSNSALKNTILALGQLAVSPFSPAKDGDDDEYECESCDDRTDVSTKSTARSSSRSDISIRTEGSLDFFSHGNSTESLSSMSSTSSTSSSACTSTCHTARDGNTHNSSNNNDGCNANTNCTSSSKFNKKAPGMKDFIVEECSTGEGYEVDSVDSVLSNRPHSPFGTGLYDNPHYDVCKQYGSMIDTGACVINVDQKVLHYAWHPHENTIAVAGKVGLYLYKL